MLAELSERLKPFVDPARRAASDPAGSGDEARRLVDEEARLRAQVDEALKLRLEHPELGEAALRAVADLEERRKAIQERLRAASTHHASAGASFLRPAIDRERAERLLAGLAGVLSKAPAAAVPLAEEAVSMLLKVARFDPLKRLASFEFHVPSATHSRNVSSRSSPSAP